MHKPEATIKQGHQMKTHLVPAFQDNYLFVVEPTIGKSLQSGSPRVANVNRSAMVVDPGDAQAICAFLDNRGLTLDLVLVTHHHDDHIGGVADLLNQYPKARLYGPSILAHLGLKCSRVLGEGDTFEFGQTTWQTLAVPGHTLDHLAYYSANSDSAGEGGQLFCGDTLFSLGCGRLFEGTFAQMFNSLQKIKRLPQSTRIYCAHEYTLRNLEFTIEYLRNYEASQNHANDNRPTLEEYLRLYERLTSQRKRNEPTLPSTLEFELRNNLFLQSETLEEFAAVREARNTF